MHIVCYSYVVAQTDVNCYVQAVFSVCYTLLIDVLPMVSAVLSVCYNVFQLPQCFVLTGCHSTLGVSESLTTNCAAQLVQAHHSHNSMPSANIQIS
jgi:hypothetical protein